VSVIASRSDQCENSAPHGFVVVNNGDQSSRRRAFP
jgi:hypothetical protein